MDIGYGRVSTTQQNTDLQLDALTEHGCERVFLEKASGAQRNRPELAKAIDFLREGDTLVVWKLDRLARSLKQLLETVEDLEARGIGFRSLTENLDTTTPTGKLVFHIIASLAEFERSIIQERIKAGIAAAKARGKVCGRRRSITDEDIETARVLLKDGKFTVAQVAERIGCSVPSLYRYIPAARSVMTNGEPA